MFEFIFSIFIVSGPFGHAQIQEKMTFSEIKTEIDAAESPSEKIAAVDAHLKTFFRARNKSLSEEHMEALVSIRSELCPSARAACLDYSRWQASACQRPGRPYAFERPLWKSIFTQALKSPLEGLMGGLFECPSKSIETRVRRMLWLLPAANSFPVIRRKMVETISKHGRSPMKDLNEGLSALNYSVDELHALRPEPMALITSLFQTSQSWPTVTGFNRLLNDSNGRNAVEGWMQRMMTHLSWVGRPQEAGGFLNKSPEYGRIDGAILSKLRVMARCHFGMAPAEMNSCREALKAYRDRKFKSFEADVALFDIERAEGRLDVAMKMTNDLLSAAHARKNAEILPWAYMLRAICLKQAGRIEAAVDDVRNFESALGKTANGGSQAASRLFPQQLMQELLLEQEKFNESLQKGDEIRNGLAKLVEGPVALNAWVDLFQMVAAVKLKDRKAAGEIHRRLLSDAGNMPAFAAMRPLGDALLKSLNGESPVADILAAKAMLGDKHPDVLRVERYLGL